MKILTLRGVNRTLWSSETGAQRSGKKGDPVVALDCLLMSQLPAGCKVRANILGIGLQRMLPALRGDSIQRLFEIDKRESFDDDVASKLHPRTTPRTTRRL